MGKPAREEVGGHFIRYVELVPDGDIQGVLKEQLEEALHLMERVPEERGDYRYEPDKWSVKESLGHIIDTERVMAYRLLCFARGERKTLPGFAQDEYAQHAGYAERTVASLRDEYTAVRQATLVLLAGLPATAWDRRGNANNTEISVRGLAYVIAGHERHHLSILSERYGC